MPVVRWMTLEQVERDGSHRPHICASVHVPGERLLRRHVAELAFRVPVCRVGSEAIVRLRDAEIDELHDAVLADEDVLRGDVAMDDSQRLPVTFELVRGMQTGAGVGEYAHYDSHGHRLPRALHHVAERAQRSAGHVLHDEIEDVVDLTQHRRC